MLKRSLVCVPLLLVFMAAYGGAQDSGAEKTDLEQQVQELKAENQQLRDQVNEIDEKLDETIKNNKSKEDEESTVLDRLFHPDRSYFLTPEPSESGFIQKGSLTGTQDKLLNINLFMAARYQAINNDPASMQNDADRFAIPFARLHLTGTAYRDLKYRASFEFAGMENSWLYQYPDGAALGLPPGSYDYDHEVLHELALIYSPETGECPLINEFSITAGLTRIFLSPAGMEEPWTQDFIEYPQLVYRLLPPILARDVGAYIEATAMDQKRLHFWFGVWNGAHRAIPIADPTVRSVAPYDAWGNGTDSDNLAAMGRVQANILDEDEYFFMLSGGFERNKIYYNPMPGVAENKTDTIYDLASEFRFNNRKTWVKGEYIHTYLKNTAAATERGYYIAAGSRLDFIHEYLDHFEILGRYDDVKLNDHMSTRNDIAYWTFGVNYYFDAEHKHDAKVMVNYMRRDERGPSHLSDDAFLVQFVLGF